MTTVSIVIPTFNNARHIAATLDSVLAQTYADFEVVVADHDSTDGTQTVLDGYAGEPRIQILHTPAGGGAERNWNRVTAVARGEFIKLVCGDDLIYPELLARQVAALQDGGAAAVMVASSRDIVDTDDRRVIRNVGLAGMRGQVDGRVALRRSVLAGTNIFGEPGCVLLRRSTLTEAGGWHGPDFVLDQATYARVLLRGDFVAVPGPLAAFRLNPGQWSIRLARTQRSAAVQLHRDIAAAAPGLLSRVDLWRGDAMAALRAWQRRAVYRMLGLVATRQNSL